MREGEERAREGEGQGRAREGEGQDRERHRTGRERERDRRRAGQEGLGRDREWAEAEGQRDGQGDGRGSGHGNERGVGTGTWNPTVEVGRATLELGQQSERPCHVKRACLGVRSGERRALFCYLLLKAQNQ